MSGGTRAETTSLREFLRTDTAGAAVLLIAVATALAWATADPPGYEAFWSTPVSVRVGGRELLLTVRGWADSGLMTFFFFVVGLEARREFDIGEMRERTRLLLPVSACVCGMLLSAGVYLAVTVGAGAAHGWGAALSTDTAFALGVLGTLGTRMPPRLRVFVLTVAIADDFLSPGPTSPGRPSCTAASGNSPPRSWSARCTWASPPPSRPTADSRDCSTPGPASSSSPCSPSPTPVCRSVPGSSKRPSPHPSPGASSSATSWASRRASCWGPSW